MRAGRFLKHCRGQVAAFFLPALIALAIAGLSTAGYAQTAGSSPDALMQRLQQQGRQGAGGFGQPDQPTTVTLQPDMQQSHAQLPVSRLEQILSQRAGTQLRLFGYDVLGDGRAVTVSQSGAVQDSYILGPGDEIVVSFRGQENSEFRALVSRDGQVLLPRLNPISANGQTFGRFRQAVEAAAHRAYVATDAFVSLGRVRQISVLVSGQVNNPGQRTVSGLSSVVDAILLSGGVKKSGSLRNVRIQRGGREFVVDLYSVLTDRGVAPGLGLADGDRILVPLLGTTVSVTGLVRQPAIFELPSGQKSISVRALLSLAGGQEVRGRYRLSVMRIQPDGRFDFTPLANEAGIVHDSEILFVQLAADQTISQATLSGGSGLAGAYPVVPGTRLSEMLKAPGALGASPYTPFGIIVRKDPVTLMRFLVPFTPAAVLAGREDQTLQSDDLVRILSVDEEQLLTFVVHSYLIGLSDAQTAIRNPLGQVLGAQNTVTRSLATQTGQGDELQNISVVPANTQRQLITGLLELPVPGSEAAMRRDAEARTQQRADQRAANAQQRFNPANQTDQPGQTNQRNQDQPNRFAQDAPRDGSDPSQGSDASYLNTNSEPAGNFIEQASGAGGFVSNREVQNFGQLARQFGVDPLILVNFLVDHRARMDGALRGPGYYFVGPNASLRDLVAVAGGTVSWADESGVELISTALNRETGQSVTKRTSLPLRQGMLDKYIVQPRDELRFNQVFTDVGIGSVTVQGEVRFAGVFPIIRGEHLSDLLARAGGLTNTAYPYGTVFLRQSAAQAERQGFIRAANEVQDQLVVAMTRVGNDKIEPNTFASMQTFVHELRDQQALGRISVVADPSVLASNPAIDPLLEAGDVIYVPQRPSTVSVLGQVLQPGSYPYKSQETVSDYIERAGGYSRGADKSQTFIILPDGSARRTDSGWLNFSVNALPPGSAIVVPRDITPLDLRQTIIDVSQVFSQFAVAIASVAVLSRQ